MGNKILDLLNKLRVVAGISSMLYGLIELWSWGISSTPATPTQVAVAVALVILGYTVGGQWQRPNTTS